ncbi:MAG: alkaline phosphatase family protein, partial [Fimbriimonadaceae bacterium]|nr:alkaline phosphatase family protein [Fimbriimonadaceae bacterium]
MIGLVAPAAMIASPGSPGSGGLPVGPSRSPKLVIVSWDGAADWVVDRLLDEGHLPNLAKFRDGGLRAEYVVPAFPSKTAVGHVAAYTGADSAVNGVTGNSVPLMPRREHTIFETRSGFAGESHFAEPFWVTAAVAGKNVLALSAAGSYPPGPDQARIAAARTGTKIRPGRFVEFSGFETPVIRPNELAPTMLPATATFEGQSFRFEPVRRDGRITAVRISSGDQSEVLAPAPPTALGNPFDAKAQWSSRPFEVRKGGNLGLIYFRLWRLDPVTGAMDLSQRGANAILGSESKADTEAYQRAYGGFHDDPFFSYGYKDGKLGVPIYRGGDGVAEAKLVEIVRFDCELLKRSYEAGLRTYPSDLVFHYTPMSDSAGHLWMGLLDPASPNHDAAIAERLWPYYRAVYQAQDEWLGWMMRATPRANFALLSDHGMAGIGKYVNLNRILEQAGLLRYSGNGATIDGAQTQALCPPWFDFGVAVHTTDWKGGIVPPERREAVKARVRKALLDARDPENGEPMITAVLDPERVTHLGMGGPTGADLYVDFA